MITEVRIYTMKPGRLDDFLHVFQTGIVPTSSAYGIHVHGAWRNDDKNELVWVRSYADRATLEAYENCPERAIYSPQSRDCLESLEVRTVENVLPE
jgi:quinol monooxygenase YgiN